MRNSFAYFVTGGRRGYRRRVRFQAGGPSQHLAIWIGLAVGLAVPIVVVATVAAGTWQPDALWLAVAVFVLWVVNVYLWCWLFVDELELDDELSSSDALRWRGLLRSGEVPLARLTEVRSSRWNPYAALIGQEQGRPVMVYLRRRGFVAFAEELGRRSPRARIRAGWMLRMADRSSLRSGLTNRY
jgi:hypothetical protein